MDANVIERVSYSGEENLPECFRYLHGAITLMLEPWKRTSATNESTAIAGMLLQHARQYGWTDFINLTWIRATVHYEKADADTPCHARITFFREITGSLKDAVGNPVTVRAFPCAIEVFKSEGLILTRLCRAKPLY